MHGEIDDRAACMCSACGGSWLGASAGTRANRGRDGGERDQDGEAIISIERRIYVGV